MDLLDDTVAGDVHDVEAGPTTGGEVVDAKDDGAGGFARDAAVAEGDATTGERGNLFEDPSLGWGWGIGEKGGVCRGEVGVRGRWGGDYAVLDGFLVCVHDMSCNHHVGVR